MREQIVTYFMAKGKLLVGGLFLCILAFCFILLRAFEGKLLEVSSVEDARLYAEAITSFRTVYTKEVASKVQKWGMTVTHDFKDDPNAIPLPATFSILLGNEISKKRHGGEVSLYSAYPFPWRKKAGGLQDEFQRKAWDAFQKKSHTEYIEFFTEKGVRYIRYAVPDKMRASCVHCHNAHPESPKRGWKVGDVRGVLEIKRPVSAVTREVANAFNYTLVNFIVGFSLFLSFLYLLLDMLRKKMIQLEEQKSTIKLQQENLVASSRLSAIGEMSGSIAHEIKNPLWIISVAAGNVRRLLGKKPYDEKRVLESLEHIEKTVQRIDQIAVGLRTVAREGRGDPFSPVPLKDVISDSLNLCSEKLRMQNIEMRIDLSRPEFMELVDMKRVQLSQVFINLFSNSMDALKDLDQKWISLNAETTSGKMIIRYKDSGKGIPREIQDKIFQAFFTTKKVGEGTGLGMSISKAIIEGHRGTIIIDNESENTCFVITIPLKHEKGQ